MEAIWMGVAPSAVATRVLAMASPSETILKALLRADPQHPRALGTLLEAVALWQGVPVRAALCVDESAPSSASTFYRGAWDDGGALYSVSWVPGPGRRRQRFGVRGVGDFRDLERLVISEVAR